MSAIAKVAKNVLDLNLKKKNFALNLNKNLKIVFNIVVRTHQNIRKAP